MLVDLLSELLTLPEALIPADTWTADKAPAASCAVYCPNALADSKAICAFWMAFCILAWYSLICISAWRPPLHECGGFLRRLAMFCQLASMGSCCWPPYCTVHFTDATGMSCPDLVRALYLRRERRSFTARAHKQLQTGGFCIGFIECAPLGDWALSLYQSCFILAKSPCII